MQIVIWNSINIFSFPFWWFDIIFRIDFKNRRWYYANRTKNRSHWKWRII